jgi:cell division protein FtsI/penicillin-binding protein 2
MNAMDKSPDTGCVCWPVVAISLFRRPRSERVYLQVMISEQAFAAAASNITRVIDVPAPRGRILDVKGRTLVGTALRRYHHHPRDS